MSLPPLTPSYTRAFRAPRCIVGALLLSASIGLGAGCAALGQPGAGEAGRPARAPEPVLDRAGIEDEFRTLASHAGEAPLLRVGLAHEVERASLTSSGAYDVAVYADSTLARRVEGGEVLSVRASASGLQIECPGLGSRITSGTVRIAPGAGRPLEFAGSTYRGEIELFEAAAGGISVVNVIDIESYLRGVVPHEIGQRPAAEIEAVKAQAVAARTYALASEGRRAEGGFDVFSTVADQVYGGVESEHEVADRAILATAGQVLVHGGRPADAYFHASCGGRTEARDAVWELPERAYLKSVWDTPGERPDRSSAYCAGGPHFDWTEEWSGREIAELVRAHLPETASTPVRGVVGEVRDIRIAERTPSGRVRWLVVDTDVGEYRVYGDRVRWLLHRPGSGSILRSSWFDLDVERRGGRVSRVRATGRGNGHGVGMCQHGALGMARRGYDFHEILGHYYPGARIVGRYGAP